MKREINVLENIAKITAALEEGILLTGKSGDKVNPMAIAWGAIGIEWEKPMFIAFIREGRYTRELLDANPEFTVNIPVGEYDNNLVMYCGTNSGRDTDKVADLNLTLVDSEVVSVPGIKELPLTLECKVLFRCLQDKESLPKELVDDFYDGTPGHDSLHVVYFAEIVKAYIIE